MGRRGDNNSNNDKHWKRIKSTLTTKTSFTTPLHGLPKDHKKLPEGREDQGHPVRPVCGATESMNGPLSDVLSEILTTLGDEMDETIDIIHVCLSTEEMYHALEAFSQKVSEDHQNNIKEPVIFSMDVAAMFPSLDIVEVARAVSEDFVNSDLEIEVDERELGLYLAIIFQKERRKELELKHLDEVVPRRKHEAAKNILMSTEEITERSERTVSKFHTACREPTREEVRRMMGVALEETVKTAMRNHVYTFNGEVRRQSEGGAIGNKLTGAMAKVYMNRWTRQLKYNLAQATEDIDDFELYVLKYYVDDNNLVMEAIPPGYRLIEGRLRLMEDRVENDRAIPADERTAKVVKQLANDICRFIQMEVDNPSRH